MALAGLTACALIAASPGLAQTSQADPDERPWYRRLLDPILGDGREGEVEAQRPPDAVDYTLTFAVPDEPDEIGTAVRGSSSLQRLRRQPPSGEGGLLRRAVSDEAQIAQALSALGYYQAIVSVSVAGVSPAAANAPAVVARARTAGPVPVTIAVEPGPRFTFGRIDFVEAANRRPAPPPAPLDDLGLEPDEPARSAAIFAAERVMVDKMRETGRPFAAVAGREAIADHRTRTLDLTFNLRPGPVAQFGNVTVTGNKDIATSFITDRAPFEEGQIFSPEALADYRTELVRYEAFDSVRIREGTALDASGRLPIMVEIEERLPRVIGFGAKYSTTEGPAANAYWGHRNLFGGAEQLRIEAQVSRSEDELETLGPKNNELDRYGFRVGANFVKPGIWTVRDDLLVSAAVLRETTKVYQRDAGIGAIGVRRRLTDQLSVQFGVEFERARIRDPLLAGGLGSRGYYTLVGLPLEVTYDSTDKPLDPTRGVKATATVEPFLTAIGSTVDMTLLRGAASTYFALDEEARFVLAGRIGLGSITGADLADVPLPRRFFAGGGGSVRGYDFQGIGPRDAFNRVVGGRSLLEASAELRIKVTDTIGIVPFVDAGGAFESSYPDFNEDVKYAAGLGLRYYTAIGPIRLDVARGLNRDRDDPLYGIYISLGQSF